MHLFIVVANWIIAAVIAAGVIVRLPVFAHKRQLALLTAVIFPFIAFGAAEATKEPGAEGWGWIVAYSLVAAVAVLFVQLNHRREQQRIKEMQDRAKRGWSVPDPIKAKARSAEEVAFLATLEPWPHRIGCTVGDRYHMLALGDSSVRIVCVNDDPFSVRRDIEIPFSGLFSADIQSHTGIRTDYSNETVQRFINKDKSPIGRALVGGMVAGPVGAIVGAVSGVGGTLRVKDETKVVATHTQYEWAADILLGTSNPEVPIITIGFRRSEDANEWLYRLQGAIAKGSKVNAHVPDLNQAGQPRG